MQQSRRFPYQQSLSVIGRYLDHYAYDSLLLCELADGFVIRAVRGDRLPEAIPFPTSEIALLVHSDEGKKSKRAEPVDTPANTFIRRVAGSYREFLAALGRQCDQVEATALLVMELSDMVLVAYQKTLVTFESWDTSTCEYLYDEAGLRRLVSGTMSVLKR